MSDAHTFAAALGGLDGSEEVLDDHEIVRRLEQALGGKRAAEVGPEALAELLAFSFVPTPGNSRRRRPTYYGPQFVFTDGGESPNVAMVTPETVSYWARRAEEAKNPLLRVRYADLVWDMSRAVTGQGASPSLARSAIDATLEIVARSAYTHPVAAIRKLKRALHLAISIRDSGRKEALRDTIMAFEDQVAEDDHPGKWGFSFDLLVRNRSVKLEDHQQEKILADLEARLARLEAPCSGPCQPSSVDAAALRLIDFRRKTGDAAAATQIEKRRADAYVRAAAESSPMVAASWLQKAFKLFTANGLKADADRVAALLRDANEQAKTELRRFSQSVEIPAEELERFVREVTAGTLAAALDRIAREFLPDPARVARQVQELAETAPLQASITQSIMDGKGHTIAQIGPVEEDIDSHVSLQMGRNMQLEAIFLRRALDGVVAKFTPGGGELVDYLCRSPVWAGDRRHLLEVAIASYLRRDYPSAVHVLVPQIEAALRLLLEHLEQNIYRPNRQGGLSLRQLDDILRDEKLEAIVGERFLRYLRVLLTDQLGWNIRNDVSHGLRPAAAFGRGMADRILHAVLLLSQIRPQQEASAPVDEGQPPI